MKAKFLFSSLLVGAAAWFSPLTYAATIDVSITNLSHGMYFTPLLITAHADSIHVFELGTEAGTELQAMAEGGDISGLAAVTAGAGAFNSENPAGGLLAPAATTEITDWDTGSNTELSIAAMILPTNDGFVGLDSWTIPDNAGTYTLYLNAYDAGTEANDELLNTETGGMSGVPGMPANPGMDGGTNGTGVTSTESNDTIHIHRGNLGDTDAGGGFSDVDSRIHRWLNPIAKVVVTVQ